MITSHTAATAELIRFLIARIDEDDDELSTLHRHQMRGTKAITDLPGIRAIERQRAECAAKRRLIGQAQHLLVLRDLPAERPVRDSAALMLRAMAEPYRGHYAFRTEWEPEISHAS